MQINSALPLLISARRVKAFFVSLALTAMAAQAGEYVVDYAAETGDIRSVWGALFQYRGDWASLHVKNSMYPFVDQMILSAATGGRRQVPSGPTRLPSDPTVPLGEMVSKNSSGQLVFDFSRTNLFFSGLDGLLARSIKPIIGVSIPRVLSASPDDYGWWQGNIYHGFDVNRGQPTADTRFKDYITALANAMIGYYGKSTVASWEFRVLWEQDNVDIFSPTNQDNINEFNRIWSQTAQGLNSAGIPKPIVNPGNLMTALNTSWLKAIASYIKANQNIAQTNRFAFSVYTFRSGGFSTDASMGQDPRALDHLTTGIRSVLNPYFPNIDLSVDESCILKDEVGKSIPNSEGTEVGAAWNAAIYKHMLDRGWRYYAPFVYSTTGNPNPYAGIPTPDYFTASLFERLKYGRRLNVRNNTLNPAPAPSEDDVLAAKLPDDRVAVLAYYYNAARDKYNSHINTMILINMKKNARVHVKRYVIDREHAGFSKPFVAEMDRCGVSPSENKSKYGSGTPEYLPKATMTGCAGTYANAYDIWVRNRDAYANLAVLPYNEADGSKYYTTDGNGQLNFEWKIMDNSVTLFEIIPSYGGDNYGNPVDERVTYRQRTRFNNDGLDDIALTGKAGMTTIPFAAPNSLTNAQIFNNTVADFPAWAASPFARILAGDFNGDGKSDLAVTGVKGWYSLPVAYSNGTGGFSAVNNGLTQIPRLASDPRAKVFTGFFDQNTREDIAVIGNPDIGGIAVALGNSVSGWTYSVSLDPTFSKFASDSRAKILKGDFNNDGRTDFAVVGIPGMTTIPVAMATSTGTFTFTNKAVTNFPDWSSISGGVTLAGDFDGDKRTDLAITGVSGWGSIPIAHSNGDGTFTFINMGLADFPSWVSDTRTKFFVGNFDGLLGDDIAAVCPGWFSVPVALSQTNGYFKVANFGFNEFPGLAVTQNIKYAVGDFTGDGRADIALVGAAGWSNIPVACGNSDGSFTLNKLASGVNAFQNWAADINPR